MLGKIEGKRQGGTTKDEMVGWHHPFTGHELGQSPGDSEGQGSLMAYKNLTVFSQIYVH